MSLYYFHLWNGHEYEVDQTGIELENSEAACLEAFLGAREIWLQLLRERQNPARYRFDVVDDQGRSVHEISFTEALGLRMARRPSPSECVTLVNRGYVLAAELTREIARAKKNLQASRDLIALGATHPGSGDLVPPRA